VRWAKRLDNGKAAGHFLWSLRLRSKRGSRAGAEMNGPRGHAGRRPRYLDTWSPSQCSRGRRSGRLTRESASSSPASGCPLNRRGVWRLRSFGAKDVIFTKEGRRRAMMATLGWTPQEAARTEASGCPSHVGDVASAFREHRVRWCSTPTSSSRSAPSRRAKTAALPPSATGPQSASAGQELRHRRSDRRGRRPYHPPI